MVSQGSMCSFLLLDVNRFILTMPLAFINHPLHHQPVLISHVSKPRGVNYQTNHPQCSTLYWTSNLYFWIYPQCQTCGGDHLAERCNKHKLLRMQHWQKKPKHRGLVNPNVKSFRQVLHQIHYLLHRQRSEKACHGALPASCPPQLPPHTANGKLQFMYLYYNNNHANPCYWGWKQTDYRSPKILTKLNAFSLLLSRTLWKWDNTFNCSSY